MLLIDVSRDGNIKEADHHFVRGLVTPMTVRCGSGLCAFLLELSEPCRRLQVLCPPSGPCLARR